MQNTGHEHGRPTGLWLIQVGVLLMTFGVGGFLGFVVGRVPALAQALPPSPLGERAERHANDAEYYARRTIVGISRVQGAKGCSRTQPPD